MGRTGAWLLLALLLSLSIPGRVAAQVSKAPFQEVGYRDAVAYLTKIRSAAQRLDYTGSFVYQQGSEVRSFRIAHLNRQNITREKLEVLDGQAREYIRTGDEVIGYLPAARRMTVEVRSTQKDFPGLLGASAEQIVQYYEVKKIGAARVAGRHAQVINLLPKDNFRFGYRLWADEFSGLLLRAQTVNEAGEVVEQIAFTDLVIGKLKMASVRPSFQDTRGWHIENSVAGDLDLSQWVIKWIPGGFKKIHAVKRMIADQRSANPSGREIGQIVYSDGLGGISIFIEPWSTQRSGVPVQQGVVNVVGKRHGDFWLTIVGEVPLAAIRQVADSIELTVNR